MPKYNHCIYTTNVHALMSAHPAMFNSVKTEKG